MTITAAMLRKALTAAADRDGMAWYDPDRYGEVVLYDGEMDLAVVAKSLNEQLTAPPDGA